MVEKKLLHEIILEGIAVRIPSVFSSSLIEEQVGILANLFRGAKLSNAHKEEVALRLREFARQISGRTTRPETEEMLLSVADVVDKSQEEEEESGPPKPDKEYCSLSLLY